MAKFRGFVITLLLAIVIGFYTTTDVPYGFTQPHRIKAVLTLTRLVIQVTEWSRLLGYEEFYTFRSLLGLVIFPQHNDSDVHFQDTQFNGVDVRVFMPWAHGEEVHGKNKTGVVFIHGGGWSVGNVVTNHHQTYELSRQLGGVVVSVDYRLAPEHLFPKGFEDCVRATKFFLTNAANYGVNPSRIAIKGDSAGGNLAAAVALRLRNDNFTPLPKLQVLIYPSLQGTDFNTPSMTYNKHGPFLSQRHIVYFNSLYLFGISAYEHMQVNNHTSPEYKQYLGQQVLNHSYLPDDEIKQAYKPLGSDYGDSNIWNANKDVYLNPYFSPLHAESLSGLPKTYINTCQFDVLRDDGYFYAGRLREAGVEVTHVNLHACFHAWMSFTDRLETAEGHFKMLVNYISENL